VKVSQNFIYSGKASFTSPQLEFFEVTELAKMMKKFLLAIFLPAVFAAATTAQSNPEQAVVNARDQFSDIKNRSVEMERVKREVHKRPANGDSSPKFPEIKEDFEQIQKINSEVLRLTAIKTPVNYAAVLKLVAEINQRAVRLKSNLFPAEHKQKKETKNKLKDVETQDVKTLLDALDKSIDSFAHNPIFQNVNVVNSKDSLKAQKDLETVINLSNAVNVKTKN